LLDSGFFASLDDSSSAAFTSGEVTHWPAVKSALLANGYRTALFHCVIAILLHHIRRTLFPWLCSFMYYTPIDDLRLALSIPDVFLNQSLSVPISFIFLSYGLKILCDMAAGFAIILFSLRNGALPEEMICDAPISPKRFYDRFMFVAKIGYLSWILATLEYVFDRSINTIAFLIAYYKLLSGGDADHISLGNILKTHWIKLPLNVWQLTFYVRSGLWSTLSSSVLCAVAGQPGLLMVVLLTVGSTAALIRYSSTFYIALQLSGVFVVLGFAALVVVLLGLEFVDDPLGLKMSTASLQRRAALARKVLPSSAIARTQILRKRPSPPVRRLSTLTQDSNRAATAEEITGGEKED
jgi:hypothetical protein